MIKLLKKMGKREVLMAVLCALLVLGQVYFDLTLPDYMTDLTMMIAIVFPLPLQTYFL